MARVLLSLTDQAVLQNVETALAETKHVCSRLENPGPTDSPETVAGRIMAQEPQVVVMDYQPEDAASVKLMQAVTELTSHPEFIFIETEAKAEREQVMMALNEGARAFLPRKFEPAALRNYVERAASGPSRLRLKVQEAAGAGDEEAVIHRLEALCGDLRIKTNSFQKLISYLLTTPASTQPRKVLVVSDSPYQLEMLKKILEDYNFQPLTASNPNDGLNLALSEKPHLIISDLELDGQNGIEFCQALKFTHKLIPCYFIICTANQDKISLVMTQGNGVDDCLIKPSGQSDTEDFISRVALGLLL
ncbi:MAG: response regulator [Candidatus Adiutrix sp.]|jgi:DNA-binding response OmpR family regulator|nr:response regulator [Candidatus Adiutrix sp.]